MTHKFFKTLFKKIQPGIHNELQIKFDEKKKYLTPEQTRIDWQGATVQTDDPEKAIIITFNGYQVTAEDIDNDDDALKECVARELQCSDEIRDYIVTCANQHGFLAAGRKGISTALAGTKNKISATPAFLEYRFTTQENGDILFEEKFDLVRFRYEDDPENPYQRVDGKSITTITTTSTISMVEDKDSDMRSISHKLNKNSMKIHDRSLSKKMFGADEKIRLVSFQNIKKALSSLVNFFNSLLRKPFQRRENKKPLQKGEWRNEQGETEPSWSSKERPGSKNISK